jgi:hypothetical protein
MTVSYGSPQSCQTASNQQAGFALDGRSLLRSSLIGLIASRFAISASPPRVRLTSRSDRPDPYFESDGSLLIFRLPPNPADSLYRLVTRRFLVFVSKFVSGGHLDPAPSRATS